MKNKMPKFEFDYTVLTTYFDNMVYLDICSSKYGIVAIAYSHDNRDEVYTDTIQSEDIDRTKYRYIGYSFMKRSGKFIGDKKVPNEYLKIENTKSFPEMFVNSINYLVESLNFDLQKEPELLNLLGHKPENKLYNLK